MLVICETCYEKTPIQICPSLTAYYHNTTKNWYSQIS